MARPAIPEAMKALVLQRSGGRCQGCGAVGLGSSVPFDIDHIVPYAVTGRHDADNLQAICCNCHAMKSRAEVKTIRLYQRLQRTRSTRMCWHCHVIYSAYFGHPRCPSAVPICGAHPRCATAR